MVQDTFESITNTLKRRKTIVITDSLVLVTFSVSETEATDDMHVAKQLLFLELFHGDIEIKSSDTPCEEVNGRV